MSRALTQNMTTPSRLLDVVRERGRLRHRSVISQLCATDGIESVLEWLFLRDVLHVHGLPEPNSQVMTSAGRVDNRYEDHGLVVELDGRRDHQDGSKDMFRDNEHVIAGRRSLRFEFNAVALQSCRAAAQVARALASTGWPGKLLPCPDELARD